MASEKQTVHHDPARAVIDGFYRAREGSPTLKCAFEEAAGDDALPDGFPMFNFSTRSELQRIASETKLHSSKLLVELPCKDGTAGLYLHSVTHCHLLGLDTSPAALDIASTRAQDLGLMGAQHTSSTSTSSSSSINFQVVPSTHDTGLEAGCADCLLSLDELWLAADQLAVLKEVCRLLKKGGFLAFTSWEHYLPAAFVKDPVADYRPLLQQAGLGEVLAYERQPQAMRRAVGEKIMEHEEEINKEMGNMSKYILGEVKMVSGRVDGVDYCDEHHGMRVLVIARKAE